MLIDWTTNIWLDAHLFAGDGAVRGMRSGVARVDASPERHMADVAAVADVFIVNALSWPRLGMHVPNDFVAEYVRRFPGRAIGFACVDPRDPGAADELRRAVGDLGMKGLKLAPTYQEFDPWCEEAWRIYALADQLRIPIYWHQASAGNPRSVLEWADPTRLDRIARAFPDLVMILEHFGLPWGNVAVQMLRKHPNMYADVSARLTRGWDMYNCLRQAMDYEVTGKILFGSDFPVQTTAEAMASLRAFARPQDGLPPIPAAVIEDIIANRPL
ncbi:MAG: amidohydrolase family protein, partial [Alphaproteobacteria bacterium]